MGHFHKDRGENSKKTYLKPPPRNLEWTWRMGFMEFWILRKLQPPGDSSRDLFIPYSWRSLNLWRGHVFTIPKRSQRIARQCFFSTNFQSLLLPRHRQVAFKVSKVNLSAASVKDTFLQKKWRHPFFAAVDFVVSPKQKHESYWLLKFKTFKNIPQAGKGLTKSERTRFFRVNLGPARRSTVSKASPEIEKEQKNTRKSKVTFSKNFRAYAKFQALRILNLQKKAILRTYTKTPPA